MYRQQRNPRSAITPVAGEQVFSRLINAVQSNFITLVFRARVTIAGAVITAIRNRGSVLALFDEVGVDENGTVRHLYDGRVLRFISETAAPSALSSTRLTSTAIGVTDLEECVRIYFAHPFAAVPKETAFLERDVKQVLSVFAKMNATPTARIAEVGAATVTLSNLSISVTHGYDASETARPFFVPTVTQQIVDVTGTNDNLQEYIKTSHSLRGLVITQETTTTGEVSDIINSLSLKGDFHDIIGPNKMSWKDLCLESEFEFGGAVQSSSNRAHLMLNFQDHGMLSKILNPNQDNNLRLEANVQASVAGTGTSRIRITRLNLERDAAIVDPTLPIPV
jgi:hypothetical protein